jgi:hypothetical protein
MAQLGLGGDSSAAYNPVCAASFAHCTCDGTLRVCFTLDISCMLVVVHFIRLYCMRRVLLLLRVPLMLIVTHFNHVSCMLYVPCLLPMCHMLYTATYVDNSKINL